MEAENGYIIVNGQPIKVYEHPTSHEIAEITGLQEALDSKVVYEHPATHSISQVEGLHEALNGLQTELALKASIEALNEKADKTELHSHDNKAFLDTLTPSSLGGGTGGSIVLESFSPYGETVELFDDLPPSEVSNITTGDAFSNRVDLSWTASSSPDIAEYLIYKDSELIATTSDTHYALEGLTPETYYGITIKSKDTNGNTSSGTTKVIKTVSTILNGIKSKDLKLAIANPALGSVIPNQNDYFKTNLPFTLSLTVKTLVAHVNLLAAYLIGGTDNKILVKRSNNQFNFTLYGINATTGATSGGGLSSLAIYNDPEAYVTITIVKAVKHLKLYMDGVDVATLYTLDANFHMNETTKPLVIGDATKTMEIKNVVYYDRALSPAEVVDNYQILKGV